MEVTTKKIAKTNAGKKDISLHTLSLTFNLPMYHNGIEAFRGAFADLAGKDADLFHNHNNNGRDEAALIYRYPRIQYRVHNGMASIFAVNEGAAALNRMLEGNKLQHFKMGGKIMPLELKESREVQQFKATVSARGIMHQYRIYKWLPLNPANYALYKSKTNMVDKLQLLENILRGQIVAFADSIGWQLPQNRKIKVEINDLDRLSKVKVLGIDMIAVDMLFSTNAMLPDRLGLGRKTAYGFGWIYRCTDENNEI